jgi:hypothetical protein
MAHAAIRPAAASLSGGLKNRLKDVATDTRLVVVTMSDRDLVDNELVESCRRHDTPLVVLRRDGPWVANALKIGMLHRHLSTAEYGPGDVILVVDAFDVVIEAGPDALLAAFAAFDADVVFSAEANFYFRDKPVRPFYWKHYPRGATPYNYLNSGTFIGRAEALRDLLQAMLARYGVDPDDDRGLRRIDSDQTLYSRFYVDLHFGAAGPSVALDHRQELFACAGGRMFVTDSVPPHRLESFLAFRAVRRRLLRWRLLRFQDICVDLAARPDGFENRLTGTRPPVLHLPGTRRHFASALARLRGTRPASSLLRSLARVLEAAGRGQAQRRTRQIGDGAGQIHPSNPSPAIPSAGERIVSSIEAGEPIAFAPFDIEPAVVRRHLEGDENSRGRRSRDPVLGRRLEDALRLEHPGYLKGVPCRLCHPEDRALADRLTEGSSSTVPARTFHPDAPSIPRLLSALGDRDVSFVISARQDLRPLQRLGIRVRDEHVVRVPWRPSRRFEQLEHHRFEPGRVVLLTCGVLGSLLVARWVRSNPGVTLLALGNGLDDLIRPFGALAGGSLRFRGPSPCLECHPRAERPIGAHAGGAASAVRPPAAPTSPPLRTEAPQAPPGTRTSPRRGDARSPTAGRRAAHPPPG